MQSSNSQSTRERWNAPSLTVYGSVEALTLAACTNKTYGNGDAFTFQQQPTTISCSS